MTLQELRYFVMLGEVKHFRKAADACHVSQPTLSVAIKKLEVSLGAPLFERYKNSVHLTDLGKQLLPKAQQLLIKSQDLMCEAARFQNPLCGDFKLGFIYSVGPYLYPELINRVHSKAPEMPVFIQEGYTEQLRDLLKRGVIDAAIVAEPFEEQDVVTVPLYEEDFVALMPADHPLASLKTVTGDDIAHHDLVLLGQGHCLRDQILQVCPQCQTISGKPQNHRIIEGSSLEAIRHMVVSGMGITLLPETAAAVPSYLKASLAARPIKNAKAKRVITLAWRVEYPRTKAIELIQHVIKQCDLAGVRML